MPFTTLFISTLVVILLIFLFKLLNKKETKNIKQQKKSVNNKKIEISSFINIKIPSTIKEIETNLLIKSTTDLYKIFKSLDYISKNNNELNSLIEWNNYEISLFLYLIQSNKNLPMQAAEEIFHSSILSLTKEQLLGEFKNIVMKYNKSITKNNTLFLKNQVIWSAKEISILLYYLSSLKK